MHGFALISLKNVNYLSFVFKKNELEKIIFITPNHEIVYSSEHLQFNGSPQLII